MSEDRYILGCNTRWPIVRMGLWLALAGAIFAALVLSAVVYRVDFDLSERLLLAVIGGVTLGMSGGVWAVALNRSKINDIIGTDVWQSPTHNQRGEKP